MSNEQFDIWNKQKQKTDKKEIIPQFKQREIFYTRMGKNIGFEQNGKGMDFLRPVLVLKKFNRFVFWGVPLSTTDKRGRHYFQFSFINEKTSVAIISQLKLFDGRRLERKIGVMKKNNFENLKKAIKELIDDSF